MSNYDYIRSLQARIEALEQENGRLREQRDRFQSDWSKAEAMLDELNIRLAAVEAALRLFVQRFDQISHGYCTLCKVDRLYTTTGKLTVCRNEACLSNIARHALTPEAAQENEK